jgi:tRNA(Ile)-lysidine synthase
MSWQEDESNVSPDYLRNRIRKNSLQALKQDVDRDVLQGMLRSRDLLEEQSLAIKCLAAEASKDCISNGRISILKLKKFPDAIRRTLINNWLQSNPEIEKISFSQTKILLDCLNAGSQEELSLSPQIRVKIDFDHLLIEKTCHPQEGWLACSLPMGHDLHLPGGQVLRASMIKATPPLLNRVLSGRVDPRREAFCFFAPNQEASLLVRTRQPGDLFKPMGAPGSKKVSEWMIDRKYKPAKRGTIPMIIERLSENIIWIPGFAPAESHRLDQSNIKVIHLTYDRAPT